MEKLCLVQPHYTDSIATDKIFIPSLKEKSYELSPCDMTFKIFAYYDFIHLHI